MDKETIKAWAYARDIGLIVVIVIAIGHHMSYVSRTLAQQDLTFGMINALNQQDLINTVLIVATSIALLLIFRMRAK